MNTELMVIEPSVLSEADRTELETNIDSLISAHKNNRQEINRLVFESVSAMTAGDDYERQLSSKSGLRRFIGGITGSNKKLQDKINSNRTMAQYAAQQTLQRLAEQNLMTFDLIAAVNNKLNASVAAVEGEINEIYSTLLTFFKESRRDMIQLGSRVERLERNVNLLNWQNAIEYQMFQGVEYPNLNTTEKIVCLVRDFYDITKGDWTTSDLLLLKTAMSTIDLSPRDSVNYYEFIQSITYQKPLTQYLLEGKQIEQLPETYLVPLLGMKKLELLDREERFVMDTITESLVENGIQTNRDDLRNTLTKRYLMQESQINVDVQVNVYDLMMEMLFNLREAENLELLRLPEEVVEIETAASLEKRYQKAAELFKNCHLKEAHPLLVELSEKGYARANALLYWLLLDGYEDCFPDEEKAKEYAIKGYQAGDEISTLQYALFCGAPSEERIGLCKKYKVLVKKIAESDDSFATYMMGICYLNETDEAIDYLSALQWFMDSASFGFYRAYDSIAIRYQQGQGVEKNVTNAMLWELQATRFPYGKAYNRLAEIYEYSMNDLEKALPLYFEAAQLGSIDALDDVSAIFVEKKYAEIAEVDLDPDKGLEYALLGAKHGNEKAAFNAGWIYYDFKDNSLEAKKWFEKSAAQGYQKAIDFLKEKY